MSRDDAEFSAPSQEEFDDFVARTQEETGRLAFALTGDEASAAALAERAYADARPLWASGEQATRQRLRERLLHHARSLAPDSLSPGAAALDAVAESGWPEVGIDTERIAARSGSARSRRRLLGLGAAGGLVLGLVAGARETYRWVTTEPAAPEASPSTPNLGPQLARRTVRVDRLLTLDLAAYGTTENHPTLVVTHEGSILGSIRLENRPTLLRLPHPTNEFQAVQLAITPPAEWIHLSGSGESLVMKPLDLLGRSVAVESILDDWLFYEMAAGLRTGDFLASPEGRMDGSKLGPQLWAYSPGSLNVVYRGVLTQGGTPVEDLWGLWSASGPDWGIILGFEGTSPELEGIDQRDYRWINPQSGLMAFMHIPAPDKFPAARIVVLDQKMKQWRIPLSKL